MHYHIQFSIFAFALGGGPLEYLIWGLSEVLLTRRHCKINTSQLHFRGKFFSFTFQIAQKTFKYALDFFVNRAGTTKNMK